MARTMNAATEEYIRDSPTEPLVVHDLIAELDAEREVSRKLAEACETLIRVRNDSYSAGAWEKAKEAIALYKETL